MPSAPKWQRNDFFSRNPPRTGFDNPERLVGCLLASRRQPYKRTPGRDAACSAQQIHQKIEIGPDQELGVDNNTALVSVRRTHPLRTGVFNQRSFNDAKSHVFLRMRVNGTWTLHAAIHLGYQLRNEVRMRLVLFFSFV